MKRRKFVQLVPMGLVTVTTAGCVGENVEEPEDTDDTTTNTQPTTEGENGETLDDRGVSEDSEGETTGDENGEVTTGVELAIVDTASEAPEDADVDVTIRAENDADTSRTLTVEMIIGDLDPDSSFKNVQWASPSITVPAASSDGTPGSTETTVTVTPSDHNGPAQYGILAESDGAENKPTHLLEILARESGTEQREIEEPDPQEFSGSGQGVVTFTAQGGMTVLETQHDGDSNFQVEILGSNGGLVGIPVNVIGDWEGSNAMGLPQGEYTADINADGSWELVVRQPRETEGQSLPVTKSGRNSDVFGPVEFEGLAEVEAEHDGDSNFQVEVLNVTGQPVDILFNEIGQFEGTTTFSGDGPAYIEVNSEGEWTISIS